MRIAALLLLVATSTYAAGPPPTIESLGWMAGCWAYEGKEAGSGETWTSPAGRTILGVSRTVRDGITRQWEFMRIEQREDGSIAFVALPSGQNEAAFPMIALEPARVVFRNPDHDFPQQVTYALDAGRSRILATIEGTIDGKKRSAQWELRKVDCP